MTNRLNRTAYPREIRPLGLAGLRNSGGWPRDLFSRAVFNEIHCVFSCRRGVGRGDGGDAFGFGAAGKKA